MWHPIETAPKDRPVLLWFPSGLFACPAEWSCLQGGNEDGSGGVWGWFIANEFSEQDDGVVWDDSPQPTLWAELPHDCPALMVL